VLNGADWDGLEQVLRGFAPVTDEECAYLKKAFVATERMWAENVAKVATVRLVMLSEAPLFGTAERYFYNTATAFSSFFHFRDAEAILGHGFAKERTGKRFLLPELARAIRSKFAAWVTPLCVYGFSCEAGRPMPGDLRRGCALLVASAARL
jgi:hypothetical protein